uniref:Large ribosomal subunit protein bL32m n=1 Tax=Knipowitschia caucasica TaxID=637954 RepID=A0AAV2MBD1_KNICA
MINLASLVQSLRLSLLHIESRLLEVAGLQRSLAPALSVYGSSVLPHLNNEQEFEEQAECPDKPPGFLDGILWMAAPKKRRTIEVNRTRRRADSKLLKLKTNIEPCPECGHLKQKHILSCLLNVDNWLHIPAISAKEVAEAFCFVTFVRSNRM